MMSPTQGMNIARARVTGCLKKDLSALAVQQEYKESEGVEVDLWSANIFVECVKTFSETVNHRRLTDIELQTLIKEWEADCVVEDTD